VELRGGERSADADPGATPRCDLSASTLDLVLCLLP